MIGGNQGNNEAPERECAPPWNNKEHPSEQRRPRKRSKKKVQGAITTLIRCFRSNSKTCSHHIHTYTHIHTEIFHFHNKASLKAPELETVSMRTYFKDFSLQALDLFSCVDLLTRCSGFAPVCCSAVPITHSSRQNVAVFILHRFHVSLPQSLAGVGAILLCSGTRAPDTSQRSQVHKGGRCGKILEQG